MKIHFSTPNGLNILCKTDVSGSDRYERTRISTRVTCKHCLKKMSALACEKLSRPIEIARANADMAIDQTHEYKDSISAYAENVRDSLKEEHLSEYTDSAIAAYYARVAELLQKQNSAPRPTSDAGADSAAAAVNSGGATSPQVLEHDRYKVTIRDDRMSGWFELDGEAIGGLIFGALTSKEPGAIELTDYDGVFALPSWVARMLREMGVHVDMTFCRE